MSCLNHVSRRSVYFVFNNDNEITGNDKSASAHLNKKGMEKYQAAPSVQVEVYNMRVLHCTCKASHIYTLTCVPGVGLHKCTLAL